jgi:hypothetical protein
MNQSTDSATPAAEAPKPMPFAIMRNAHEALRAGIAQQAEALERGDAAAFGDEWQRFQRALAVHMAMEDGAMFAILDAISGGAIGAAKLPDEHLEDVRLAAAVDGARAAGDIEALRRAWDEWQRDHLHHLAHEEEVMMPLTMKTAATPQARARVVHERLVVPFEKLPDFDWYIGWVVGMLARHGSSAQPPAVATRVFAWGLQLASSREQWQRFKSIVERNCAPAIWAELTQFGLDGDGQIA